MDKQKMLLDEALARMTAIVRLTNRIPRTYGIDMLLFPTEIHMVEAIANHPDSNTTDLAILFNITKGSVSKMLTKLHCKGLIERYQDPSNKKEVYFRLTELGNRANQGHAEFHSKHEHQLYDEFATYTKDQQDFLIDFINKYTDHVTSFVEDETE